MKNGNVTKNWTFEKFGVSRKFPVTWTFPNVSRAQAGTDLHRARSLGQDLFKTPPKSSHDSPTTLQNLPKTTSNYIKICSWDPLGAFQERKAWPRYHLGAANLGRVLGLCWFQNHKILILKAIKNNIIFDIDLVSILEAFGSHFGWVLKVMFASNLNKNPILCWRAKIVEMCNAPPRELNFECSGASKPFQKSDKNVKTGHLKIRGYPEFQKIMIIREKWDVQKIRGYPDIPENHDTPEKRDIWRIAGTRKFQTIVTSGKSGHWKNRGYPEIPENHKYRGKSGHLKNRPHSKIVSNVRSIITPTFVAL